MQPERCSRYCASVPHPTHTPSTSFTPVACPSMHSSVWLHPGSRFHFVFSPNGFARLSEVHKVQSGLTRPRADNPALHIFKLFLVLHPSDPEWETYRYCAARYFAHGTRVKSAGRRRQRRQATWRSVCAEVAGCLDLERLPPSKKEEVEARL